MQHQQQHVDYLSTSSLIQVGSFSALLKRDEETKRNSNQHIQLEDYFGEDMRIAASMEFYEMESKHDDDEEEEQHQGKHRSNTLKRISANKKVSFQPFVTEYEWEEEEEASKSRALSRIGSMLLHATTQLFNKREK